MTEKQAVLIVDDDSDVRWMVKRYLGKNGFDVDAVSGAEEFRKQISQKDYCVCILDITMPGEDGLSLARWLRAEAKPVGIIMLTAATEVIDRVIGLEMGADDYVTKPFEPRELLARVKSLVRRTRGEHAVGPGAASQGRVAIGVFTLDTDARQLLDEAGEAVSITSMEYDLLLAFSRNPGRVLSRERLLDLSNKQDADPFDRSIDIRIARLRKKIEADPAKPQVLKTVRGAGYMFVNT